MEAARVEAQRAIELDPTLPEAYPALGLVDFFEGDQAKAEQDFRRLLATNPNFALPHHWLALLLESKGQIDEALVEIDRAVELDPLGGATIRVFSNSSQNSAAPKNTRSRARRWPGCSRSRGRRDERGP